MTGTKTKTNCSNIYSNLKILVSVHLSKTMKMAVLWVVAPCSPVETELSFRGRCCLHLKVP